MKGRKEKKEEKNALADDENENDQPLIRRSARQPTTTQKRLSAAPCTHEPCQFMPSAVGKASRWAPVVVVVFFLLFLPRHTHRERDKRTQDKKDRETYTHTPTPLSAKRGARRRG